MGIAVYNGTTSACNGLHGHVHVAPDGTVWLPVSQCNGQQGGALSTDAGTTWTEFAVPGAVSQPQGADPSIAIDADSTVYYAYVNNETVAANAPPEGHARVKVGHRNSVTNVITWTNDFDLGLSHGIRNAVEIEAVGGSSGRAAVGFLGTDVNGDYQALTFPGKWYAFIATTYDGGVTWTTVNATPNDPVQSMTGIWQQGGGNQDRNLLDFNEITVDDKGRVLYGYSDGCVTVGCIAGVAANDFTANMRVARQSGGKSIYASYDVNVNEPAAPKPACLSGTRDSAASHLTWKIPDNGGSDIIGYQILRGTTAGSETEIVANTGNAKTTYNDTTADPNVPHYFYVIQAINTTVSPIGLQSNEVDLTVPPVAPPCVPTGHFLDTLEPPQLGWTFDPARNDFPASTTWALVNDPTTPSPSNHSFESDASASAAATKDDRLIAPPQDLTPTSHLIFWHRFQFEDGFDGGVLEVSRDGGGTWVDVLGGGGSFVSGGA